MAEVVFEHEGTFRVDADAEDTCLLDLSKRHGVPHTAACGGKARCSTCRVLVLDGAAGLAPRTEAEAQLAGKKGLEDDIRLACQAVVRGDVRVRRLVRDRLDQELVAAEHGGSTGREATVAVLFSDIRDFTPFAEGNLPYDVVHALNRYFRCMGDPVLNHGGYIDKYMGDGLMALFGIDAEDAGEASRGAVRAGVDMIAQLEDLNAYLARHVGARFEIGIGIHVGEAVVGNLGHPQRMQLSAIGDTVNIASRIESATKEHGARLLVSEAVHAHLGDDVRIARRLEARLKGKPAPMTLYEVLGAEGDASSPGAGA